VSEAFFKPPDEFVWRLARILSMAWLEARCCAGDSQRSFDLADAMHNVPQLLVQCTANSLRLQREAFARYCAKYPSAPENYLSLFEEGIPDELVKLLWFEGYCREATTS
jgi:hypothetical protein